MRFFAHAFAVVTAAVVTSSNSNTCRTAMAFSSPPSLVKTGEVTTKTTNFGVPFLERSHHQGSRHPVGRRPFFAASMATNSDDEVYTGGDGIAKKTTTTDPTPVLSSFLQEWFSGGGGNLFVALALAFALSFSSFTADPAMAAMSGGRMGGGSFGRSGGGGGMIRSMPSPSRSYYGPPPGGRVTVGPTIVAPYVAPPMMPLYAPPPTVYYGPGPAAGVAVVRGPSIFDLMFFGGILFVMASFVKDAFSSFTSSSKDYFGGAYSQALSSPLGPGTSVIKLSVALNVPNRRDRNSILSTLQRMSDTSGTQSRRDVGDLVGRVSLELLRKMSSGNVVMASAKSKYYGGNNDLNDAERQYNSMSVRERAKFEQETIHKYKGVDYGRTMKQLADGGSHDDKATMAVVTILLAIDGNSIVNAMPKNGNISSQQDLETVLRQIASDVKIGDCLQTAEILWTPVDPNETLTSKDVASDYPDLRIL